MFTRMAAQGIVTLIYTLEFAGLLVAAMPRYKEKYYVPVKMLCSVSFVLIAVMFAFISGHMQYFYFMVIPLICCAVGDLFMGFYQVGRRRRNMLAGMLLFLTAHVGFLVCFFHIDMVFNWWNVFLPVVMLAVFAFMKRIVHLHMGRFAGLAAVYCVFLSLMLSKCTQYMVHYPSLASVWLAVGGSAFFISDFTIIFLYFYKFRKAENRLKIHYLNLATYYFGIFAFDVSILYFAGM